MKLHKDKRNQKLGNSSVSSDSIISENIEHPPENMIFETVEDYYIIVDMRLPEYNYYAIEYWDEM